MPPAWCIIGNCRCAKTFRLGHIYLPQVGRLFSRWKMPLRSGRPYLVGSGYIWLMSPYQPDTLRDKRRLMRVEKAFIRQIVAPHIKGYHSDMPFDNRWLGRFNYIIGKGYTVKEKQADCHSFFWHPFAREDEDEWWWRICYVLRLSFYDIVFYGTHIRLFLHFVKYTL